MRTLALTFLAMGLAAFACSSTESGTIGIVTGEDDAGPFNEHECMDGGTPFCGPAPKSIRISEIVIQNADGGLDGATTGPVSTLGDQPYSGGSVISLPQESGDDVVILQATAYDSAGKAIIFGQTLPVQLGGIDGITLDLFVQRKAQFALMPTPFSTTPLPPLLSLFENRLLLVADGTGQSKSASLYDFLLSALDEAADGGMTALNLPCAPLSMAPVPGTTFALLICAQGSNASPSDICPVDAGTKKDEGDLIAFEYDISGSSCTQRVFPPGGHKWQNVAGGATVIAPNGDAFIVGGTRTKSSGLDATNGVIRVNASTEADGGASATVTYLSFRASRLGAAAAWSTMDGLVILSGNVDQSVGVETLSGADNDGSTASPQALNFAADETVGEGVILIDPLTALVAGGTLPDGKVAPVRTFDLSCSTTVCPVKTGDSGSAVPLTVAQGFLESGATTGPMFVGVGPGGTTRTYKVNPKSPFAFQEVPLQNANRKGTRAIVSPVPSLVVVGGDTTMESYIP
jgi:hypothetical protein